MGKGSNTTTQNTSTAPDPNAYQAYLALLNRASGVAGTPYQGYGGQEVAPINAQQTAGVGNINAAQPGFTTGFNQIQGSSQPLTPEQIAQYQNPFTSDVVNATMADFDTLNKRANSTVVGNAAAQGALGGDRSAVAQEITQEGQTRAEAPVIAGLRQSGYQQGIQTAEDQQKLGVTGGQAEVGATTAQVAGAGQQVAAGTLEQTTQQAADTQARADYYQQKGYDFQVAQWLAALDTGVGSQMGGTGTGVTQGPTPNPWAQAAGVGLAGASLFAKEGGRITEKRAGFASGGIPYGDQAPTWVPTGQIHPGSGAPHVSAPSMQKPQGGLSSDQMKGIGVVGKGISNSGFGDAMSDYLQDTAEGDAGSLSTYIGGSWRGGRVKRYAAGGFADGGDPNFDDRYDAAFPNYRTTAGIGASAPAFDDRFPHEDDRFDVATPDQERAFITSGRRGLGAINPEPGDEVRLDPSATRRSMDETDAINGPDIAAAKGNGNVMAGVSAIRSAAHLQDEDAGAPEGATAYQAPDRGLGAPRVIPAAPAPAPEDQPEGGLLSRLGIHVTPEMRQGLLQAGLAMMATTRGGPGSFLGAAGEAGMAGVGSYNKSLELAQKQQELIRQHQIQDEKLKMERETHEQQMSGQSKVPFGWKQDDEGNVVPIPGGPADPTYMKKASEAKAKVPFGWMQQPDGSIIPIPGGPTDPTYLREKTAATKAPSLGPDDAKAIARYTVATGDDSRLRSLGFNPQNKALVQSAITQEMNEKNVSDTEMATRRQQFAASGISKNAAARTQATREENLNMVLKAANAAIPAALEESEKVQRYAGIVPFDRMIQRGQIITNDPNLVTFGMANLQLAEHWARAMNPMGVMRESDRDLALHYLDTAFSKGTYKAAVMQLAKQVTRERDAIREGKTTIPGSGQAEPGAVVPSGGEAPKKGERKQFKQGWGVWDGQKWVPE